MTTFYTHTSQITRPCIPQTPFAWYSFKYDEVFIMLYNIKRENENELIDEIILSIHHEQLHKTIFSCRKEYGEKHLWHFFEEKIVADITGEKFSEDDYAFLLQMEEQY